MKYIKIFSLFCAILAFTSTELIAQADTVVAVQADDSVGNKVNVAYKEIDQRDLHGAITVINPEDYINVDYSAEVQDGLNSRISGLLWENNIWGMEDALVLIDGIRRNFSDIRLEEVEQITVLKGINAVALYGSYAAKGAILISTKRGTVGEMDMDIRVSKGIASPLKFPEYLGSAQYMQLYNEARLNDGREPAFEESLISQYQQGNRYRYPDVDYYSSEYLGNFVNSNNVNAEFKGGNESARFYSSLGWTNNSTLLDFGEGSNENDNRYNVRGNVDLDLNSFISSTIDVSAVLQNSRRGFGDYWEEASSILPYRFSPLLPIGMISPDSTGVIELAENSSNIIDGKYILGGSQEYLSTPFSELYARGYQEFISRVLQITNTIRFDLGTVVEGLSFNTRFNADYYNGYTQTIDNQYSIYTPTWASDPGNNTILGLTRFGNDVRSGSQNITTTTQTRNLGLSMYFDYNRTFNEVHNVSGMLISNALSQTVNDTIQPDINANLGLQLGYNYDHRYWVDFSGAVVNSTKLPEESRVAFSPTISLAWLMSSEEFMSGASAVDHLKLSTSAGIVNTDLDINDYYLYQNIYAPQGFYSWHDELHGGNGTASIQGGNPALSFVKRKEINAGLDASFFKELLYLQATYFVNVMDGLPTQQMSLYPSYFSDWVPYTNYNSNKRSGMDVMLNLKKQLGEVELNIGVNALYANSEVVQQDELYADEYQNRAGKPVDAIFGLENDGFFEDESDIENSPVQVFGDVVPGDIKYVDQNGDGIIDSKDEVEIGKWGASLNYGILMSASYRGFTLFVRANGANGGTGMKDSDYYWVDGDDKYSEVVLDRWTEETKNSATYPRLSSQANNNNNRFSDFWTYSTDQLNLSKVQLSYSFPKSILGNAFVKELGIYINGSNLLTIAENKDILDLNISSSPQFRYFNGGIRANF